MTKDNQGSVRNFLSRYFPRKYPTIGDRASMNGIADRIPTWRQALTLFGSFSATHWPPRRAIEPGPRRPRFRTDASNRGDDHEPGKVPDGRAMGQLEIGPRRVRIAFEGSRAHHATK